jgi:hypothetical protein
MAMGSLRVAVLCCDGLYQRHLIRRVSEEFTLVGVVVQVSPPDSRGRLARLATYRRPLRLLRQLIARLMLRPHDRRGAALQRQLFHHNGAPPELPEGVPELVGVTVHHIDPGIDSGDIILSARVPMQADDDFETIDVRSFHVGVELMLEAVRRLEASTAPRVPQWEQGKLFLRRTGYVYEPWQRLLANRSIARGLVRTYLADQVRRDGAARVVQGEQP